MENNQAEKLAESLKIARSVAWGAADSLSSFYHQDTSDLKVKEERKCVV